MRTLVHLLWLTLLAPGCGVTEVLDRAADGRPILIRCPQVDADDLAELHAAHGIKTVLNLRGEHPEKGWFQEEKRGVEKIGARWVHVPISGSKPLKPEELKRILGLIEDPSNWPILVHCQGGIHRTGAVSALYRMQYQGWKPARAVAEMEDNYFNWTTRDRDALKQWLLRYVQDPRRRIDRSGRRPAIRAGPEPRKP